MVYPEMAEVELAFNTESIPDVQTEISTSLNQKYFFASLHAGDKVGITAGSRGISTIVDVLRAVIKEISRTGASPYILATMGSHGGGTATGQKNILDALGIDTMSLDVPILTETESTQIGYLDDGLPVYCLNHALEMNHLVVINRIKPHEMLHLNLRQLFW